MTQELINRDKENHERKLMLLRLCLLHLSDLLS